MKSADARRFEIAFEDGFPFGPRSPSEWELILTECVKNAELLSGELRLGGALIRANDRIELTRDTDSGVGYRCIPLAQAANLERAVWVDCRNSGRRKRPIVDAKTRHSLSDQISINIDYVSGHLLELDGGIPAAGLVHPLPS